MKNSDVLTINHLRKIMLKSGNSGEMIKELVNKRNLDTEQTQQSQNRDLNEMDGHQLLFNAEHTS